jgi:tetratricopeptide (TPR) repeat protein
MGLWSIGAARNKRRWGWNRVLWLPAFALAIALAQLMPLPGAVLRLVSTPASELRDFALVPLGLTRLRPISMDASSTARALARVVSLAFLLATSLELGRQAPIRRRLLSVLALSGVSVALCGFVHLLAQEDELFGVHRFVATLPLVTPFGNTNHLAAFLTLTGTVGLALALDAQSRDAAIGWGAAALACGVAVFLSYSRGGIGTFVITWAVVGAAVLARRGGGLKSVIPWVVIGLTVAFAALLSFEQLVARADTVSSVEKLRSTKLELWPMLFEGAVHYWPAGLGLGAFELGFARFQTQQLDVTFTHPENLVLQWLAEVGVPLALLLFSLAVMVAWRLWEEVRGTSFERYVYLAVVGVVLHDVFDFALELNAVAACTAVVVGLLAGVNGPEKRVAPRWKAPLVVAGLCALAVIALVAGHATHLDAEQALAKALATNQAPGRSRVLALEAIDRHPADWVLYANMAADFARHGDPLESLAWTNRVLFLRPADAQVHTAAGRALVRLGRVRQALGEFKQAWGQGDLSSLELGLAIAAHERAWERVVVDGSQLATAYGFLRSKGKVADSKALLLAAAEFPPSEQVAKQARVLLARHEAEVGDATVALGLLDELPQDDRDSTPLVLVRVRVLFALQRREEALAVLERLQARSPSDVELGLELASALTSLGRPLAAIEALARLKPFVVSGTQRAQLFVREGELWASQERWGHAIESLQTASRIEPTRPDLHYRLGQLYERMGSTHSALDEVRKGRTLDSPAGAKAQDAWVSRLEASQVGP